jgi:DNA-binding HxlR family transcriptional regulator
MQNNKRRALAGSSRALDQHGAVIESGVLLALSGGNTRKDFSTLLRELQPVGQSSLAAALVALRSDNWVTCNEDTGRYCLTARGLDMIQKVTSQRQRGGQARRRAA